LENANNIVRDPQICIDFYSGSHGNFLEFVCNKMAGVETKFDVPFCSDGTAHCKQYIDQEKKIFFAEHWTCQGIVLPTTKIISVHFTEDDILPLAQISFLRSGNFAFDTDHLEHNTYEKLNNSDWYGILNSIKLDYFVEIVRPKYNAVCEELSLPKIHVLTHFETLPAKTRQILADKYDVMPLAIDKEHPDCPRHILRNFYERNMTLAMCRQQQLMKYKETQDVHRFPYASFYNEDWFIDELKKLATWANLQYNDYDTVRKLHSQFMKRQPYARSKQKCDQVVQDVINNTGNDPDTLNLFEESYVNAQLVKLGHERRYRY